MRSLLAIVVLATLTAPAAATPVRFRSVDGCYDLVSFHFTVAPEDIVDLHDRRILAIPEPALFHRSDAEVHVTVELGPYNWPAGYQFPDRMVVTPHQPRPFFADNRGRWYVWDAHEDTVNTPDGQPQVFNWGVWSIGERINVQAVVPSGKCRNAGSPGGIGLND